VFFNGSIDVGLFEFMLAMKMDEVFEVVYYQPINQICMSSLQGKISLEYVVFKFRLWSFQIVQPCMHWSFLH
jgi:hypothetical protein